MLFSGGGGQLNPLAPGDAIPAPEPSPTVSRDHAIRLKNPVWAWDHNPATPSKITNLRSKVLGMGMNYSHAMIVCQEISVDEVGITDKDGNDFKLPLEQSFVMHKWNIKQGIIPSKTFPCGRLRRSSIRASWSCSVTRSSMAIRNLSLAIRRLCCGTGPCRRLARRRALIR